MRPGRGARWRRLGALLALAALVAATARAAAAAAPGMRAPAGAAAATGGPAPVPETSSLALGLRSLVTAYRVHVSPLTSGRCGFFPSCSTYGLEALRRRGALEGAVLIGDRLTRCNIFKGPRDYTLLPGGKLWDPLEDNLP